MLILFVFGVVLMLWLGHRKRRAAKLGGGATKSPASSPIGRNPWG